MHTVPMDVEDPHDPNAAEANDVASNALLQPKELNQREREREAQLEKENGKRKRKRKQKPKTSHKVRAEKSRKKRDGSFIDCENCMQKFVDVQQFMADSHCCAGPSLAAPAEKQSEPVPNQTSDTASGLPYKDEPSIEIIDTISDTVDCLGVSFDVGNDDMSISSDIPSTSSDAMLNADKPITQKIILIPESEVVFQACTIYLERIDHSSFHRLPDTISHSGDCDGVCDICDIDINDLIMDDVRVVDYSPDIHEECINDMVEDSSAPEVDKTQSDDGLFEILPDTSSHSGDLDDECDFNDIDINDLIMDDVRVVDYSPDIHEECINEVVDHSSAQDVDKTQSVEDSSEQLPSTSSHPGGLNDDCEFSDIDINDLVMDDICVVDYSHDNHEKCINNVVGDSSVLSVDKTQENTDRKRKMQAKTSNIAPAKRLKNGNTAKSLDCNEAIVRSGPSAAANDTLQEDASCNAYKPYTRAIAKLRRKQYTNAPSNPSKTSIPNSGVVSQGCVDESEMSAVSPCSQVDMTDKTIQPHELYPIVSGGVINLRLHRSKIVEPIFHKSLMSQDFTAKVQILNLSRASISPQSLVELLTKCSKLHSLDLEELKLDDSVCEALVQNQKLNMLNLPNCTGFTSYGIRTLLGSLKSLHTLNISWTNLDNEALDELTCHISKHITRLNIAGCDKMTDEHLTRIVNRCPQIYELDLSDCTQLGSKTIDILSKLENLEYLSLSRCYKIGMSTNLELTKLHSLAFLDTFDVFDEHSINVLSATFPNIGINRGWEF